MQPIDRNLSYLLNRIVPAVRAEAVYLFGSRVRGEQREDSDYDLLVVVPDDTPRECLGAVAGYETIRGAGIPADVILCRRSGFDRSKDRVGTLSYEAFHNGRLVYGQ